MSEVGSSTRGDSSRPGGGPTPLQIRFLGSGSEYFRIWIVNLLLTIVTLTLYYPFAKVRRLRYFHGATEVDGHPLAFHGDPWKMFRGYAIMGALMIAYGVAERASALAAAVAFVAIALLWPALWHSSLRFRLANTGWRGLRMRFTGGARDAYRAMAPALGIAAVFVGIGVATATQAAARYGTLAAGVPLLALLVLGPGFIWVLWRLKRYQHDHYRLAGEQTSFRVKLRQVYVVFARAIGLALLAMVAAAVVTGALFAAFGAGLRHSAIGVAGLMLLAPFGLIVLFALFQVVVRAYLIARLQNLYWNGTVTPRLRFRSTLGFRRTAWLTLRNWVLILLTLGLYYPFAAVAMARLRLEAVTVWARLDPDALVAEQRARHDEATGDAAGDLLGIDIGL